PFRTMTVKDTTLSCRHTRSITNSSYGCTSPKKAKTQTRVAHPRMHNAPYAFAESRSKPGRLIFSVHSREICLPSVAKSRCYYFRRLISIEEDNSMPTETITWRGIQIEVAHGQAPVNRALHRFAVVEV